MQDIYYVDTETPLLNISNIHRLAQYIMDLTQLDGWMTQDGRMTKKRRAGLCISDTSQSHTPPPKNLFRSTADDFVNCLPDSNVWPATFSVRGSYDKYWKLFARPRLSCLYLAVQQPNSEKDNEVTISEKCVHFNFPVFFATSSPQQC